jgi:exopolysaccharide production protein ExoQ
VWGKKNVLSAKKVNFFLMFVLLIHTGIHATTVYIHYFNTSVFFLSYSVLFLWAFPDIKRWLCNFSTHIFLSLMLIWTASSIIWSTHFYLTFLGLISLFGMLLVSFYLLKQYSMEEILDLLVSVGFILLSLSIVVILFFPDFSRPDGLPFLGRWKGLFGNPNHLGMYFYLFSVIFSLALYFKRPIKKSYLFFALFLAIIFLYNSKSITTWVTMAVFVVLFGLKWFNINKNIPWNLMLVGLLIMAGLIIINADQLIILSERSISFSIRIDIWTEVWAVIQKKSLLGNGYLGFWYDEAHKISIGPVFLSSHSGYLEIIVYLGFIGLFLFFMVWIRALFLSAQLFFSNQMTLQSVFPFLFLVTYSLQNIMESTFFLDRSLLWILFIYFVLYLNDNNSRMRSS